MFGEFSKTYDVIQVFILETGKHNLVYLSHKE